jgi:hypothetical protein
MIKERDHPAFRDRWETDVAHALAGLRAFTQA